MTSRRAHIAFFLFGLAAFLVLVVRFGVGRIEENIGRAGWSLFYIVGVWLAIYILNAGAWKLLLGARHDGPAPRVPFFRLFRITVSGFVINYVTPFLALGGEPYKVNALAGMLGPERGSLSAVVLYRMVHLLGHMLLLLTGIVVALAALALPLPAVLVLAGAGFLVAAVIALTVAGHRDGVFGRLVRLAARLPLPRAAAVRLSAFLASSRHSLEEMDRSITGLYRESRGRIALAVALEFASRVFMGLEVYLILRGVGVETSIPSALFLYVAYSVVINLLFFIPLNLGAREGGLALGLGTLALPPLLGVYLGVVMRLREFVWILIGLSFMIPSLGAAASRTRETAVRSR